MRFNTPVALCLLAGTFSNALPSPQDPAPSSTVTGDSSLPTEASRDTSVANDQLEQLAAWAQQQANDTLSSSSKQKRGSCTLKNLSVRREWNALSATERKAYTSAVRCLQKKKSNTPSELIPGAKSRFDDWVGTHINQTQTIHYTGTFLAWHRYFTWQYEQALRNECGYTGYQPYWNWGLTAATGLDKSPMLDGSDSSMGGNGDYVAGQGEILLGSPGLTPVTLPHGSGGGCVTKGPFKDMTVNLGPVALALTNGSSIANGDGLAYNPRCLKRDITNAVNEQYANASAIVNLILNTHNVYDFQMTMQGVPGSGNIGVHGGGHYSMGGDPGRDLFVSPGEPLFYLHHGMIDRTWWIWQLLNAKTAFGAEGISGTGTFLNSPPSPNTTLDTLVDLQYAAQPPMAMGDLLSTVSGPFCYIYL